MDGRRRFIDRLDRFPAGKRVIEDLRFRMVLAAACSFLINLLYAVYHGVLGIYNRSLWFIAMCAYYTVLGVLRLSAVLCERRNNAAPSMDTEYFVMRLSGALFVLLSFVLTGVVFISLWQNIAVKHDTIVMITIATYTFYKATMAGVQAVRQRKNPSPLLVVIRRIGTAEAAASILTLQRSMVATFGTPEDKSPFFVLDILTGAAVCLFVLALGINMMIKKRKPED